jgi:hypothetical protein
MTEIFGATTNVTTLIDHSKSTIHPHFWKIPSIRWFKSIMFMLDWENQFWWMLHQHDLCIGYNGYGPI